jgi:hypothetical protein
MMHGNNPTRDSIERALAHHAQTGAIRSWKRLDLTYSGAPKWEVTFNPEVHDATVPVKTYQEGKLVCGALASAEARYNRAAEKAAEVIARYQEAATAGGTIDDYLKRSMGGYTDEQLRAAFERVACRSNWKDPIACDLPADLTDDDRRMIDTAITHWTGSIAEWTRDGDGGCWTVRAAGYYASIGS